MTYLGVVFQIVAGFVNVALLFAPTSSWVKVLNCAAIVACFGLAVLTYLVCLFTFGCMGLVIYIVADGLEKKAQWEVERSGARSVSDGPQSSAPSPLVEIKPWDDETEALYRTDVVDLDEALRRVKT